MKPKTQKQAEAIIRQAARNVRTARMQLDMLNIRLGRNKGATRERTKLQRELSGE